MIVTANKLTKHRDPCEDAGYGLIPFAAAVYGIVSRDSYDLMQFCANMGQARLSRPYLEVVRLCRQRISCVGVAEQLFTHMFSPLGSQDRYCG